MVNHEPKDGIPWQWKYEVELFHNGQDFHEINQWLEKNIGIQGKDWSGYGVGIGYALGTERKSVYLFNKKEHAILFKTVWVV